MRYLRLLMTCSITVGVLLSEAVFAQGATSFPSHPVTVIVATAPGGPNDAEARMYATKMTDLMGQPFVIEFKPGAGGNIGTDFVVRSAPDGYTMLFIGSSLATAPALYKNLPFDPVKDLAPVALMTETPLVLFVRPSFPAKNLTEYLAWMKANPGKLNFAMTGTGSTNHIAGLWLHSLANTQAAYIPFKGMGPIMVEILADRADAAVANLSVALPFMKSNKIRALAILGDKRSKLAPDLPTVMEQGVPEYNFTNRVGFYVTAATPAPIINKLNENLVKVTKMPDVVAPLEAGANIVVGSTPAQFKQLVAAEVPRWQKIIKDAGIEPQ